jgi:chromosome segregation ATPase
MASLIDSNDPKILNKNLEKILEHYEELKKDFDNTTKELQNVTLELNKARRRAEEWNQISSSTKRNKLELDIEFKRISDMKKENDINIRELTTKLTELQIKYDNKNNNKTENEQRKVKDLAEVDQEKESLKNHQRNYDKQLDDERRLLQSKFVDAKLELQKSIQKEVDDLKLRHDRQLGELERNKRRIMSDIIDTSEKKKIIKLDHENHQLNTKLESLHRLSAEKSQFISEIEKKLRRELLNIEVQGTSKIDWLKEQSTPSDILRHFKMQERKIEQLRYKLNQTEEEVAFENRQTVHSENISKELQRELHDEELRHQRLEAVKDDLEKRLTDRVEQLERELNSKNSQLEAEFSTLQLQLEASITDKDDLISVIQQEIEEISQLVRDSKLNTQKLSGKLVDRLDTDRNKFTYL